MDLINYDLILEWPVDNSQSTRDKILSVLNSECGLDFNAVRAVLELGPFTVQRSSAKEELILVHDALEAAGGKVQIAIATVDALRAAKFPPKACPVIALSAAHGLPEFFARHIAGLNFALAGLEALDLKKLARSIIAARNYNRQIFILGNGGSAANASRIAADLSKRRFTEDHSGFRVISLVDNVPQLTATANDFGYGSIFASQLQNLMQTEDLVIAISASGNSANVLQAIEYANSKGAHTFGIAADGGGRLGKIADELIVIPTASGYSGFMEDVTSIIGHALVAFIYENDLANGEFSKAGEP